MSVMLKRSYIIGISLLIVLLPVVSECFAAAITGKVIAIADGDTITVLQNKTQYKIRLYGIDTPEKAQDFGKRAKQFTSDLVYGKDVKVIQEDIDRYGRIVGMVYVDDICVNEAIVKNGFAWVYQKYCSKPICQKWLELEKEARSNRSGLWRHDNPVPPWDFRRGKTNESQTESKSKNLDADLMYHGNIKSKVFHKPGCSAYNCKNCTAVFHSRNKAIKAEYRPCGNCKP